MTTQAIIEEFLSSETFVVVGVSRMRRGFGYVLYNDLKKKGYKVFPVNPNAKEIDGDRCFPDVHSLPVKVDCAVLVIPPSQAEAVVHEIADAGIQRVWMQQGAESDKAIEYCKQHGIDVVSGECIMMFLTPKAFPHNMHRWVRGAFGKLPE